MTPLDQSELMHYGVLGMKWGIRKDPDKAYAKSIKKLRRLDSAHAKAAARVEKMQKKGYEAKSAKLANKAAKLSSKSAKLSYKAAKLERKSDKAYDKAMRSWTVKGHDKAMAKSQKLATKSEQASYKADRLISKSKKLEVKSRNFVYKMANADYKNKKLQAKGEQWVARMNKEFSGKTLSSVSKADIDYGRQRAVEIAKIFKETKHSAMTSDEIYKGVLAASESLSHYGVKGMKWGVRKDKQTSSDAGKRDGAQGGGGTWQEKENLSELDQDQLKEYLESQGLDDLVDVQWLTDPKGEVVLAFVPKNDSNGMAFYADNDGFGDLVKYIADRGKANQGGPHGLGRSRKKDNRKYDIGVDATSNVSAKKPFPSVSIKKKEEPKAATVKVDKSKSYGTLATSYKEAKRRTDNPFSEATKKRTEASKDLHQLADVIKDVGAMSSEDRKKYLDSTFKKKKRLGKK